MPGQQKLASKWSAEQQLSEEQLSFSVILWRVEGGLTTKQCLTDCMFALVVLLTCYSAVSYTGMINAC